MDFGLHLGCLPSTMKQKLHNHPRDIEMASFLLTTEWWDSSRNSREEKYEILLSAVHSMGKKCTAKRLGNLVKENTLACQAQTQPPCSSNSSQHLEGNPHPFIGPNPLEHISESQLAICNVEGPVIREVSGNSLDMDENSTENEEERSSCTNNLTNRTRDLFSDPDAGINLDQVDSDLFERKTQESSETGGGVDLETSLSRNNDQKCHLKITNKEVDSSTLKNKEEVDEVKRKTETEACKIPTSEVKLNDRDEHPDVPPGATVDPDFQSPNPSGTSRSNPGFTCLSDVPTGVKDLKIPQENMVAARVRNKRLDLDDPDVVNNLLPEVHISNAPCQMSMLQKPGKSQLLKKTAVKNKVQGTRHDEGNCTHSKEKQEFWPKLKVFLSNGISEPNQNDSKTNENFKNVCFDQSLKRT